MINSEYETDLVGWSIHQAEFLRRKEFLKLDIENIITELEDLNISEIDKLESHLTNCLIHMLKIKYQSEKHTRSWDLSIKEAKYRAARVIRQNPSLKSKIHEILHDAYYYARLRAAMQTGLEEEIFPVECPFDVNELMKEKEYQ